MYEFLHLETPWRAESELFNPEPQLGAYHSRAAFVTWAVPVNCSCKLFVLPGVNTVTTLVENKKAQLVVIAHDVDPIEVCQIGW